MSKISDLPEVKVLDVRNRFIWEIFKIIFYRLFRFFQQIELRKAGGKHGMPKTPAWLPINTLLCILRRL
jgi:hypothetical protein